MNDYMEERKKEHFQRLRGEATQMAKWGLRLLTYNFFVVLVHSLDPGKWFYVFVEWTMPLVLGLGCITFLFAASYSYEACKQIRGTSRELFQDQGDSDNILYKCLIFVVAFVITFCIVVHFGIDFSPDPWVEREWL